MSLRWFLPLYSVLWHLGLPLAVAYLLWRARRDPRYRAHMAERFGWYRQRMAGAVWIHAVSLGEVRSAMPLVRALLERGDQVIVTHFTPAGRAETERALAPEIAAGRVAAVWVPVETSWAYAAFFRAFRPRAGLVMEVEHWPRMILSARTGGVPLYPCNAQYPARSFDRDRGGWRFQIIARYAGALVKSDLQADRFRATGLSPVVVTGETRFDQPIPPHLVTAGRAARAALAAGRQVIAIASAVEGEDDTYLRFINALNAEAASRNEPRPLLLYIPRRPERFDEVAGFLTRHGLAPQRRSALFDAALALRPGAGTPDLILGDSLGEMYFYLAMADRVIVGGGFTPAGAHNIIEPLAMGRPVATGPVTWPIEYPFAEAQAAGLATACEDPAALVRAMLAPPPDPAAIADFVAVHSGAAARTLAALDRLTSR